ncbi:porin (plasmid) [Enterococcus raffinosus]|uniref:porin n=1 Tax=Enterococcus raffinosus TaxID=71452 RepID=UPI001C455E45|nr:porin [Enterococcus raffinosus]QXJ61180.1 porin [Enterococcus raffinosus]
MILEKYVYLTVLSFCIFLQRMSFISFSVFLLLSGIISGIVAGRVFLFRKYELFLFFYKDTLLSENGKIIVLCTSVVLYILSLSFIAIGSWLCVQ